MTRWLRRLLGAARALTGRSQLDLELEAELQDFAERVDEDGRRRGMSAEESARSARIARGSSTAIRERISDVGWESIVDGLCLDVRCAVRGLRRSPGFTLVATATLALGIGGSATIFSLVEAILLKPLPIRDPGSLVVVRAGGLYPVFQAFQQHTDIFTNLCATGGVTTLDVDIQAARERADVSLVSGSYFATLGVPAVTGRVFSATEDVPGHEPPIAVASDGYWLRRFGRDPSIVGRVIRISNVAVTIIGVAQPGFTGERLGASPDLWMPLSMWGRVVPGRNLLESPGTAWLQLFGRIRPSLPQSGLQPELTHTFRQVVTEVFGPQAPQDVRKDIERATVSLEPAERGVSDVRANLTRPLQLLMGAVLLVLLIGCANIASLLLARARASAREVDLRLALGISRSRLVRQLLTESLLLAALGGTLGLAIAWASRGGLLALISSQGSGVAIESAIDERVLLFVVTLSSVTVILFGLVPAWHTARASVASLGVRQDAGGPTRQRLNASLVVSQVALAMILLTGAGLFSRTVANLRDVDLGFVPERLLLMDVNFHVPGRVADRDSAVTLRLRDGIQSASGVTSVSFSENGLLMDRDNGSNVMRPEEMVGGSEGFPRTHWDVVGPGYFTTLNSSLVHGRDFSAADDTRSPAVIAINEAMARRFFGDANPLGRRLQWGDRPVRPRIVAIVRDVKAGGPRDSTQLRFYIPYLQLPLIRPDWIPASVRYLIRTAGEPSGAAPLLRSIVAAEDPQLSIARLEIGPELVSRALARERSIATLLGIFSVFAVGLACIGLYGLINYQVLQRRSEIGIRMALGSSPRRVMWTVLGPALRWTTAGVAIGVPCALLAARIARGLLFGLSATNGSVVTIAVAVMSLMGLLAAYLPARRASRIDPLVALRGD